MKDKGTKIKKTLFRIVTKKQNDSKNVGITLIALVVTIIVLLILAGVVLSLTVGSQGILNKTINVVDKYENASNEEHNIIDEYIEKIKIINEEVEEIEEPFTLANIGIDPETPINEIVTNTDGILNTILSYEDSTKYFFENFDIYKDVSKSQSSMQVISNSSYALEILKGTDIPEISNSQYWQLVYNKYIPRMTNDTNPSGVAYASNISYGNAYKAFEPSINVADCVCANQTFYVQYQFADNGIIPRKILYYNAGDSGFGINSTGYVAASVDGTNYETIVNFTDLPANTYNYINATSTEKYKYFRCYITKANNTYGSNTHRIYIFNVYGL